MNEQTESYKVLAETVSAATRGGESRAIEYLLVYGLGGHLARDLARFVVAELNRECRELKEVHELNRILALPSKEDTR